MQKGGQAVKRRPFRVVPVPYQQGIDSGGVFHFRFRRKVKIAVEGENALRMQQGAEENGGIASRGTAHHRYPAAFRLVFKPLQHLFRRIQAAVDAAQVPLLENVPDEDVPSAARNPGSEPFKRIPQGDPFMEPGAVVGKVQVVAAEINGAPRIIPLRSALHEVIVTGPVRLQHLFVIRLEHPVYFVAVHKKGRKTRTCMQIMALHAASRPSCLRT